MINYRVLREKIHESHRNGVDIETIFAKIILHDKKPRYDLIVEYLIEVSSAEAVARMLAEKCYSTALKNVVALLRGHGVSADTILKHLDKSFVIPEGLVLALVRNGVDHDAILERIDDEVIQKHCDELLKCGVEIDKMVKKVKKLNYISGGTFIARVDEMHGNIDTLARNVSLHDLLKWYDDFNKAGLGNGILIQKFNKANIADPCCYSLVHKKKELIQNAINDCNRPKMKRDCQEKLDCLDLVYSFARSKNFSDSPQ